MAASNDAPPLPGTGRIFRGQAVVRLGDATVSGRIRLDAVARFLQDVAEDDVADARWRSPTAFLLRRCAIAVSRFPRRGEHLSLATYCSATSARWAERTTVIEGAAGGRLRATALWVAVDVGTARPVRLDESFSRIYGPSAGGRTASARLTLGAPPDDLAGRPWSLRATDLDAWGHVNNAVHWEALEEYLAGGDRYPSRAVIEYRQPMLLSDQVELLSRSAEEGADLWLRASSRILAAARLDY